MKKILKSIFKNIEKIYHLELRLNSWIDDVLSNDVKFINLDNLFRF